MANFFKKIVLSVPFLIFFVITVLDVVLYFAGKVPEIVRLVRDGFLLAALILWMPLQHQLKWFKERRVFYILRNIFIIILLEYLLLIFVDDFFPLIRSTLEGESLLHISMQHFVVGTLAALILTFLSLVLVALLRILVLYKSKGSTLRNFRFLLIAILLYAAVSSAQGQSGFYQADPFEGSVLSIFSFSFLIVMIILNGFRTSWIHFLNRKQKWGILFMAIIASLLGWFFLFSLEDSFVDSYSIAFSVIIRSNGLFFNIYSSIAALMLLLNLPTARIYDEKINALKTMQELTQSVSHFMEKQKLMDLITKRALEVTKSDLAWLEFIDAEKETLELASSINLSFEERKTLPLHLSSGVSGWVIQNRQSLLVNDVNDNEHTAEITAWKKNIGALLSVPLVSREQIYGVLCAAKLDYFSYDQFDQDMLQALADQAAIAFENSRLLSESIEKERLAQELRVAHDAQEKLLPKVMPVAPGIEVTGVSVAAHEVGGDYYDVFQNDQKMTVVVGDVSGKGTAAAFYMAEVKGVIEALGKIYDSPKQVLIHANQILCRSFEKNQFISVIYAVFDLDNEKMTLSRAGHNPLLWCPYNQEPSFLQPNGIGIGLDTGSTFSASLEEITMPVSPGDFFVFYTDGVVEARNSENREFEEEALLALVQQKQYQSAGELREDILNKIDAHVGATAAHDDFTLVVVGIGDRDSSTNNKQQIELLEAAPAK